MPKSNVEFWKAKIERNVARDVRNEVALKALGWRVARVWECEIKTVAQREEYLKHLYDRIVNSNSRHYDNVIDRGVYIAAEPNIDYGKEQ